MTILVALAGCAGFEDDFWSLSWDVREEGSTVYWGGYVLSDAPAEDVPPLSEGGSFEVMAPDGSDWEFEEGLEPRQPYANEPAWWSFTIEEESEIAIRVDGPDQYPTVWRTRAPTAPGPYAGVATWLYGALFARAEETVDTQLEELAETYPDIDLTRFQEDETAMLWGEPWEPDDWDGAGIRVTGGDGADARIVRLDEDGQVYEAEDDGPVSVFLAFDLAPGIATATVSTPDGIATEWWPVEGGEIVSASWFALGLEE